MRQIGRFSAGPPDVGRPRKDSLVERESFRAGGKSIILTLPKFQIKRALSFVLKALVS
jgi:hypothetical protein